ncbi:MAG: MBL fold metallo-hydrolase [bacterium]
MDKRVWWVMLVIGALAVATLFLPSAQARAESSVEDEEQAALRDHGTRPDVTVLPETAVDSEEAPNLVIRPEDAGKPLPVYMVAPNTWFFFGNIAEVDETNRGSNANAGFVVTPQGVVAIDTLGSPALGRRLIATIKEKTDKPIRYLIITHNHPDHAYGSSAFSSLPGIQVVASAGMNKYIGSDRMESSVNYRKTFIEKDMEGFELKAPDIEVDAKPYSKKIVRLGGEVFEVYSIGNVHSDGDLVVYQKQAGVLWVSDLAFNQRVTFIADGHSENILEAQEWLTTHFPHAKLMIPGHGSAQTPPFPMLAKTRDYIERLRETMGQAVENDIDLQDAVDGGDFPDWEGVRMYQLNHRKNLNFVYTEMEEALF